MDKLLAGLMASNGSRRETWSMFLVSAAVVVVADSGHPECTWIAADY